jgi:hypothetical protein
MKSFEELKIHSERSRIDHYFGSRLSTELGTETTLTKGSPRVKKLLL